MPQKPAQTSLDLRPAARWGGRRPGAGRPPGPRPKVWHRSRASFRTSDALHLTLRVRSDVPSLRSVRFVRQMERSLRVLASARSDFRVVHYSLQSNHAHFLVEAKDRDALGRGAKALGIRLARVANRVFRRRGAVLDDRYHQRVVRTLREARHALAYVLLNARRHAPRAAAARRGAGARLDPASSARWFDGWHAAVPPPPDPPAVSPPRTWLLGVGWRRHGRVDPGEVPGGLASKRTTRPAPPRASEPIRGGERRVHPLAAAPRHLSRRPGSTSRA